MAETAFPPLHPAAVLCVVAHADDAEAFMGGTVAKYAAAGSSVHYLVLTDGSKGGAQADQATLRKQRRAEQQAAASKLGVQEVTFADYKDCELELSDGLKRDIVRAIRRHKPQVVMCLDPTMLYSMEWGMINHPDHRVAGEAVFDAVYPLACNEASFPELLEEGLTPHRVETVLMANCDKRNFYVDISQFMDVKIESLKAHASQAKSLEKVFRLVETTAEQMGGQVGAKYAEAFVRLDLKI